MIAIITARGGSKRLPGKNMRQLAGRPLIAYSIDVALASRAFDAVVVTTDDPQIAAFAAGAGAAVVERPPELAGDAARSSDAIVHVLDDPRHAGQSAFCLLQPTSPLRTAENIRAALEMFEAARGPAVVGCRRPHPHPYKSLVERDGKFVAVESMASFEAPDQSLPKAIAPNGAIYVAASEPYRRARTFFAPPPVWYEMDEFESTDIDTAHDLAFAEFLLTTNRRS